MNAIVLAGLVVGARARHRRRASSASTNVVRRLRERRRATADDHRGRHPRRDARDARASPSYATLIVALAAAAASSSSTASRARSSPTSPGRSCSPSSASMVVALTVTPALSVLLLSRASFERDEPPLVGAAAARRTRAPWRGSCRRPRVAVRRRRRRRRGGVHRACRSSSRSLLPTFKERAAAGPLGRRARDVAAGDEPDHRAREPRAALDPGRAETSGRTSAAPSARRPGRSSVNSGRALGEHRSPCRLRRDVGAGQARASAATRACLAERRDVLERAREDGARRTVRHDDVVVRVYGEDLDVLRRRRPGCGQAIAGVDGVADRERRAPGREPTVEIEVDLAAARRERRSSRATCAARRPRCSADSRSAACSRSRRSSTWSSGARPRPAAA